MGCVLVTLGVVTVLAGLALVLLVALTLVLLWMGGGPR